MVFGKSSLLTSRQIYFYSGTGTSVEGIQNLASLFKNCDPSLEIHSVLPDTMQPDEWDPQSLLVFPGGKCGEWDREINLTKIQKIRSFVERGGGILGVCAGAYFCCKKVLYQIDPFQLLQRSRELAFFPGSGAGPLLKGNQPQPSRLTIQETKIRWEEDQTEGFVLMNGGGYFIPDAGIPAHDYQVLARYVDQPDERSIAVVKCKVGKGTAILSGPHLEYNWENIPSDPRFSLMRNRLKDSDLFRLYCLKKIYNEYE